MHCLRIYIHYIVKYVVENITHKLYDNKHTINSFYFVKVILIIVNEFIYLFIYLLQI